MHLDRTLLLYGPKNVLQLKGPINIEEGYVDMNGYRASGEDATSFDLYAMVCMPRWRCVATSIYFLFQLIIILCALVEGC